MLKKYNKDKWTYCKYDTLKYNFRELISDMFGRDDLENFKQKYKKYLI